MLKLQQLYGVLKGYSTKLYYLGDGCNKPRQRSQINILGLEPLWVLTQANKDLLVYEFNMYVINHCLQ
jgi:hypothetical protein